MELPLPEVHFRALMLAVLLPAWPLSGQQPARDPDVIARLVDSLTQQVVAEGLAPALGVAVVMDGRTVYARSHGMTDVTAGVPVDDSTLWYLASTSKSLTGFGVSLLAQRGLLQFDTPITSLLPGVQWHPTAKADSLTLAHFLSHTHNLDDKAVVLSAAFTGEVAENQWPQLIRLAERRPAADLVYSNFGYNVAAMVIDRLRPEGWKSFLEANVYRPAGMLETYARISGINPRRIAKPHVLRAGGKYESRPFFKTDRTMNSAGGHLSTLRDLARWTIVQMDSGVIDGKRVFPAAAIELSQRLIARHTRDQSRRFAFFDREGWAAGWDIGSYQGEPMVSRFGSYDATRSHLSFLPRRRVGVVAMSSGGPSVVTDVIAAFVFDLEAGRSDALARADERLKDIRKRLAEAPAAIAAQDSTRAARQRQPLSRPLSDFTGTFRDGAYGAISFKLERGALGYRWGDLYGPVEIYDAAKSQMRIEMAGSGTVVTFGFDAPGPATSVTINGITLRR